MSSRPPFDPISRELNRRILTRVPGARERIAQVLWWLLLFGGMILLLAGQDHGKTLWMLGGLVITLGGFFGSLRDHDARLHAQPGLDDRRIDELMAEHPKEYVVRRRLAFGLPLTLTIMSIPFFFVATHSGATPAPVIIGAGLFVACLFSWYLVLRLRIPFLRLSASGMYVNRTFIPWQAVADIRGESPVPMFNRHSKERQRLLVILYDPLSDEDFPRGALGRFARGDNHRELYLSLARTQETPAVVYEMVRDYWQRARQTRQVKRVT
jgi:hypothetical protein